MIMILNDIKIKYSIQYLRKILINYINNNVNNNNNKFIKIINNF
jgi:hypothetical protein